MLCGCDDVVVLPRTTGYVDPLAFCSSASSGVCSSADALASSDDHRTVPIRCVRHIADHADQCATVRKPDRKPNRCAMRSSLVPASGYDLRTAHFIGSAISALLCSSHLSHLRNDHDAFTPARDSAHASLPMAERTEGTKTSTSRHGWRSVSLDVCGQCTCPSKTVMVRC